MATGQTLVTRAMRLIGAIEGGASPITAESNDVLEAMNAMLDSWRNDRLMAYARSDISAPMVIDRASYTVFPSTGDFDTDRPVKVDSAYMTVDGVDYPVDILNEQQWFSITDKTVTGDRVQCLWYNPAMSEGVVKVWPVPSATNALHLVLWAPIETIGLSDTIAFPPGWEEVIAYNLAIRIAPEFPGSNVSNDVRLIARNALNAIRKRNVRKILLPCDLPVGRRGVNILTDE